MLGTSMIRSCPTWERHDMAMTHIVGSCQIWDNHGKVMSDIVESCETWDSYGKVMSGAVGHLKHGTESVGSCQTWNSHYTVMSDTGELCQTWSRHDWIMSGTVASRQTWDRLIRVMPDTVDSCQTWDSICRANFLSHTEGSCQARDNHDKVRHVRHCRVMIGPIRFWRLFWTTRWRHLVSQILPGCVLLNQYPYRVSGYKYSQSYNYGQITTLRENVWIK